VNEERFPSERGFLPELEPFATPLNLCRHFRRILPLPTTGCVDRSGKPLASWWTHRILRLSCLSRVPVRAAFAFGGIHPTCLTGSAGTTGRAPDKSVKWFAFPRATPFAGAWLISRDAYNDTVVDRLHRKLKTKNNISDTRIRNL
jgi:hypothetical protein